MYRDDPLDDEQELRDVVSDDTVDQLVAADVLDDALEVYALLAGWASEDQISSWYAREQGRLEGRTPVAALVEGDSEAVLVAARAWAAANG